MPISTPSTGTATVEVDALVVGAGAAGMTAALVASLEGLDVLLCEKSDRVGGTTATSAGTIWVPGTRQSRNAGFTDNVTDAKRYLSSSSGPRYLLQMARKVHVDATTLGDTNGQPVEALDQAYRVGIGVIRRERG